ncbi:MAG: tRNA (adenosine(37)-N6)-threonylcarbamoyltransferase complex transferase subunit TsaD [Deltaproteobacteria bacterium]|nr:tRNA (adenosine(37)-N6)-threonylcarbamoyltransferase complex transferase subunit TsaD [Deltaproteobacteria bacterium]
MKVLGIDTSCDETAAGVVVDGRILSSAVRTQFDLHSRYGGVVPELASRRHVEAILPVMEEALSRAGMRLSDLDGLAVTQGPGLVGALLVGLNLAKAVAMVTGLPLVGVNHLHGHVAAGFLVTETREYPLGAMVVSGGHTNLYLIHDPFRFELLGQTRDDAAGEAFDKVAKLLDLGYPGGRIIDELAAQGDPRRFDLPRPMLGHGLDFSFSGLKTAVVNLTMTQWAGQPPPAADLPDLAASFQAAVVEVLTSKIGTMLNQTPVKGFILAGGVACNRALRQATRRVVERRHIPFILPPPDLCTDNGAMIAALGAYYLEAGHCLSLSADAYSRGEG